MEIRNRQVSRALGWFGVGLGLTQICCPGWLARTVGVRDSPDRRKLFWLLGLREIGSGLAILSQEHPVVGMEARAAGDLMDLGLMGAALHQEETDRGKLSLALAAVVGITVLDWLFAEKLRQS